MRKRGLVILILSIAAVAAVLAPVTQAHASDFWERVIEWFFYNHGMFL